MALHHTAQGLAGLGRHGDSVLVHMQPQEVAGLQALAQSQGTSLTVNPNTGMPEAFRLGDFFKSLLPTLIGIGTGGAGLPLYAGIAAGASVGALTNKEDPLMGALMGGLGGYGGQGIGSSLFNAGSTVAPATTQVGQNIATSGANTGSSVATIPQQGMFNAGTVNPTTMATNLPYQNAQLGATQFIPGSGPNMGQVNAVTPTPGLTVNTAGGYKPFGDIAMDNLSQTGRGFSGVMSGDEAALEAFRKGMGAESNLGAFGKSMLPVGGAALTGLEPSDLGFGGPSIDDLQRKTKYRGPSGQLNLDANYNPDTGEYEGLPSLQLAAGGAISGAGNYYGARTTSGGNQDLYGSSDNAAANTQLSQDGYGIGRLDKLAQQGSLTKAGDMFYAAGGPVSFADGGDTESSMNLEGLPSLNLETGRQSGASMGGEFGGLLGALMNSNPAFASQIGMSGNAAPPKFAGLLGAIFKDNPDLLKQLGVKGSQYAQGGYLDGPGDGLSDSIPATIEGKQPARLADGEFVVSSDVVSGLGNGSSKAGAKKLYAMMDRVRQQAHGTKKQIRKVNEKKVMPDLA